MTESEGPETGAVASGPWQLIESNALTPSA